MESFIRIHNVVYIGLASYCTVITSLSAKHVYLKTLYLTSRTVACCLTFCC